jgi:carbon monoxide dehydrogenase subunit G
MIVSGEITLPAPRETVFQVLQNAPFFASCVEGVRDLKEIDATHYDAVLDTKVAYMKFSFKVSVEVTKLSPPDRIEAKIEGTPLGIVGRFTAVSTTELFDAGDETLVKYTIDANITGKLGSMGQPVLKSKAKDMEQKFAEKMHAAFAGPASPSPLVGEGRGGGSGGCGTTVPHSTTPTPDPSPAEPRYSEGSATQQSDRSRLQPTSVGGGEKKGSGAAS